MPNSLKDINIKKIAVYKRVKCLVKMSKCKLY